MITGEYEYAVNPHAKSFHDRSSKALFSKLTMMSAICPECDMEVSIFSMSSSLTSTFATLIDRTFLLFLRHENPSICILGVQHAVLGGRLSFCI
jgi:hypothetical protein